MANSLQPATVLSAYAERLSIDTKSLFIINAFYLYFFEHETI